MGRSNLKVTKYLQFFKILYCGEDHVILYVLYPTVHLTLRWFKLKNNLTFNTTRETHCDNRAWERMGGVC